MTAISTITTLSGVAGAVTFVLALTALIATATTEDRALRRLAWLRAGCTVSAVLIVAASLVNLVSPFALGAACLALLLSVHAIWLATREPAPLQSCLDRLTAGGDAAWRDDFERPFREYERRHRAPTSLDPVRDADRRPHRHE